MDDLLFAANGIGVLGLKQVLLVLLFVVIFDQAAPPISHLIQTITETLAHLQRLSQRHSSRGRLLNLVRLFPDVVSYEFFHAAELRGLHNIAVDL